MKPIAYTIEHVDTDLHACFPLVRLAPIVPAPIVTVGNTVRVFHTSNGMVQVRQPPCYPRVILKGDWT